jgi:hypothetical protein
VAIEIIPIVDRVEGQDLYEQSDTVMYAYDPIDALRHEVRTGEVGCLVIDESMSPNACRSGQHDPRAMLWLDTNGVPGNLDFKNLQVLGWRGTSNDICRIAHGVRRVESVAPRKRGYGTRVILSDELRES